MIRMASAPHIRLVTENALQAHTAAGLFRMMTDVEFDALVSDIRENGQREAIVVYDGMILDGRNRYRACERLGIPPRTIEWDRKGTPEAFVVSMNLHRRHLNESERGMIAGKLVNVRRGDIGQHQQKVDTAITIPKAAELMNVSVSTVDSARVILDRGTPEEVAAAMNGEIGLGPAARQIRSRQSPEKRKAKRDAPLSQTGNNPERIQRMQMHAEIWARLSEAITGLTSLPLPSDVAEIINANPSRRRIVDERLARAIQWLDGFQKAMANPNE